MNLFKKYPYIITDLDGTIAGEAYQINAETYEALRTYQLISDYHLFIASGRLDLMAKEAFAKLKIKTPIISCNGALIRDSNTNEILYQVTLPQYIAIQIIKGAQKEKIDHIVYTANMIYGNKISPRVALMMKYNENVQQEYRIPLDLETDYLSLIEADELKVLKILFPFNSVTQLEKLQNLIEPFKELIEGVFLQKDLYDIQALNINKGNSFRKLCELKGYNPEQFIFYGDNYNDVELAKSVGYAVAMGNSVLELKKVSATTTNTINENGVREHLFSEVLSNEQISKFLPQVKEVFSK